MAQTLPNMDKDVQADVSDELLYTPSIDAHLVVTVDDGVVTIAGEVASVPEQIAARRAAKRVWGVKSVVDAMQVRVEGTQADDADIERAARQFLDWSVTVPADLVTVRVRDQVLILTGTVVWAFQRDAARDAVINIAGVLAVRNDIVVAQRGSVSVVKTALEASLRRNAPLDAPAITVVVDRNAVTLRGHVRSAAERYQAEQVVWSAAGVATVDNDLRIAS